MDHARLGEQLLSAGVVSVLQLNKALQLQRENGGLLLDVLIENNLIGERKILQFLADRSSARFISSDEMARVVISKRTLDRVPKELAEKALVLPLSFIGDENSLTLAVAEVDPDLLQEIQRQTHVVELTPVLASRRAIRAGLRRYYHGDLYAFAAIEDARRVLDKKSKLPQEMGHWELAQDQPTILEQVPLDDRQVPLEGTLQDGVTPVAVNLADMELLARELRLLRVANELHQHLAFESDPEAILHRVLAFAFDNLEADDGLLLRIDAHKTLITEGVRSRFKDGSRVVVSETLVREVLETRRAVITGDALSDSRFAHAQSVATGLIRSAMGVPLIIGTEVRGLLFVCTRQRVNAFTRRELMVLIAIASQAAIALKNVELTRKVAVEEAAKAHLARFFSPGLVEMARSGAVEVSAGGEIQEAAILFADIRGFTSLAEKIDPRVVVSMLNEHFGQMVELVFAHGGILDKFIGDAILALWGVPLSRADAPERAVRAALAMVDRVKAANELRRQVGKPELPIGVGVNTGPVVFGAIGSEKRMEFTAIGDAVNIAARLCAMAKPGEVLISEATLEKTPSSLKVEEKPSVQLKGKSKAVRVFTVRG